ncbi:MULTISPECIES: sulfotransferase family protein [Crocosphaera]|uniref:Sulfotransferase n=3 Tax=Crocosphaera watsonii TaxID=263511 RepID=G5J338_CROWT|nr:MULTISPECIES: sulfotransferase [Crocosphaera]EHJ13401.1 Sulfotransferase [Crocosphaera watsonii WH 0003]MCH2244418.1 sulfotransferase [Crocosphaera sp.]CCQ57373.1 Sulfotransferase [Crocosphaera watsonii WH 0005]
MKKLPNFIIIGAMKCATSSLHEQLNQQPGIFMSELKEPNFFSNDEEYNKGSEWYLSHFEEANINDLIGESSTHYTKLPTYPHTIERLQKYLPDAKFIYVMRHPINRLVSQYIHEWSQRVISVGINESIDPHPELLEYSLYTKQLQPYFDTFGQERVLPIFFERMLTTPQTELERICRFIGYKDQPQWYQELNASNVSNQRMIKSAWRDAIVETPGLKQLRRLLIPKSFRTWVRSLWTIKKKPDLTAENIDRLTVIFDEDLAVLGSWLGVDLTCDNFQETVKNSSLDWVNITRT